MRNPHLDRTLGHEANRSFTQGWKQGWGDRRPPAQTIWKANPHQGERAIGRNPFKWNFDSGRQGFENWKRGQEGPNTMIPLASVKTSPGGWRTHTDPYKDKLLYPEGGGWFDDPWGSSTRRNRIHDRRGNPGAIPLDLTRPYYAG